VTKTLTLEKKSMNEEKTPQTNPKVSPRGGRIPAVPKSPVSRGGTVAKLGIKRRIKRRTPEKERDDHLEGRWWFGRKRPKGPKDHDSRRKMTGG